ncbi:MAG: hypothetical protein FWC72_06485 [Oscillospiraceae bacterium]|nr:hypothetical protein [Oscillospiraceae bacterium]
MQHEPDPLVIALHDIETALQNLYESMRQDQEHYSAQIAKKLKQKQNLEIALDYLDKLTNPSPTQSQHTQPQA